MRHSLARQPQALTSHVSRETSSALTGDELSNVIKLFPLKPEDVDLTAVVHREARIQVIQRAVEETLNNPQHPYYSIGSQHREQMRRWIVEVMVKSCLLQDDSL